MNSRYWSIIASILVISFCIWGLLAESLRVNVPFSLSINGDLSLLKNKTTLQLWTSHGESRLDGIVQPQSPCEDSFTSTTCSLLNWSAYLVGVALLNAIFVFLLALVFSFRKSPAGSSRIWGIYILLPALGLISLVLAIVLGTSAGQRLLNNEFQAASVKTLIAGIQKTVQETVANGITNQWALLKVAAGFLQWKFFDQALSSEGSSIFNTTLSTACNYKSITNGSDDPLSLALTTPNYISCLQNQTATTASSLNSTAFSLFHNQSLVLALNQALNLSLPETLIPSALYGLVEENGYSLGNASFRNISNTVRMSVAQNAVLSYGPAYYILVGAILVSLVLIPATVCDFYQRYYYMSHHFATQSKVKSVI